MLGKLLFNELAILKQFWPDSFIDDKKFLLSFDKNQ